MAAKKETKKETKKEPEVTYFSNKRYEEEQEIIQERKAYARHRDRLENMIIVMTIAMCLLLFDYSVKLGCWSIDGRIQYWFMSLSATGLVLSLVINLLGKLRK